MNMGWGTPVADQLLDLEEVDDGHIQGTQAGGPADRLGAPRLLRGGQAGPAGRAALRTCGMLRGSIGAACPFCTSLRVGRGMPVSGKGVIYSYQIVTQAVQPAFADWVPYPSCWSSWTSNAACRGGEARGRDGLGAGRRQPVQPDDPTVPEAEENVAIGKRVEVCFVDLDDTMAASAVPAERVIASRLRTPTGASCVPDHGRVEKPLPAHRPRRSPGDGHLSVWRSASGRLRRESGEERWWHRRDGARAGEAGGCSGEHQCAIREQG